MKTIILDDDPTGTQSSTGVTVLLRWDADAISDALGAEDAVFLLTNTRAVDEADAVDLVSSVRDDARVAEQRIGEPIQFVLRGDSTLRGHVFAESAAVDAVAPILFVPAFPGGGRITVDGTHLVKVGEDYVPAHESEYAADPVFGYRSGHLPDYVREKSDRRPVTIPLEMVRGDAAALATRLAASADGEVLLPDVETDDDIARLAEAVRSAWTRRRIVVRSGSPLAAAIAGVTSSGLLERPVADPGRALLVCGSHTQGATAQLALAAAGRTSAVVVDTDRALSDPGAEARRVASLAQPSLAGGFAAVVTERIRRADHDTLAHGEAVMRALVSSVAALRGELTAVVSKGGITGAEVARTGLGADRARVRGQVLPGVSVWDLITPEGAAVVQVVVPGNVGSPDAIDESLRAVGA